MVPKLSATVTENAGRTEPWPAVVMVLDGVVVPAPAGATPMTTVSSPVATNAPAARTARFRTKRGYFCQVPQRLDGRRSRFEIDDGSVSPPCDSVGANEHHVTGGFSGLRLWRRAARGLPSDLWRSHRTRPQFGVRRRRAPKMCKAAQPVDGRPTRGAPRQEERDTGAGRQFELGDGSSGDDPFRRLPGHACDHVEVGVVVQNDESSLFCC